jgi:hypothetical protein
VSLIGLLIGFVLTTMTGLKEAKDVAMLFVLGAGSVFTYFNFPTRPWVLVTIMLYGLAFIVACANELMMLWFPNLNRLLAFALYADLSPVIVICMAAGYPVFHRWRYGGPSAST